MAGFGSAVAKMLIDSLEKGETLVDSTYVPCELIIRKSCGPKAT